MALSTRFLGSTILFSSTSDYEKELKREIFLCHKNLKLSMSEIMRMSVADRRAFITLHNKEVEKEKREIEKTRSLSKRRR